MKIAVIGTGGREHAIAVKSLQSPDVQQAHVIPGNSGMLMTANLCTYPSWDGSFTSLEHYLRKQDIELVIVGNEAYLQAGIVDYFATSSIKVFGPTKDGAKLEYSKNFAKQFMHRHNIPTAGWRTFTDYTSADRYLKSSEGMIVVKQDGLALGKGVLVTANKEEAGVFLRESFESTDTVVFEEFLEGPEFSLLAFVNRDYYNLMIPARDYKRAGDNDEGLNTGGMGAYAPVDYVTAEDMAYVESAIVKPTITGLLQEGIEFTGILYFGLMKTANGVKVIEYNTRFGDPEAEVLLEAMQSDLVETVLATLAQRPYRLSWKDGYTLGVCLASKGYPRTYEKGYSVELPTDISCYSMALERQDNSYVGNGGRVVFVVSSGDTMEDARSSCYADVAKIGCEHIFHRNDIGLFHK
ncbi:phosphoribosylamine--glycine ligase [Pleomorphochaeta sp. DL1XJH-081]|uniref:phosphoribosylamine--glycine ligase n=1 Tax=Pleomorphochaeta sp. DL1XJH-081 TaxID=3409690 RepID=UPI003BB5779A